MSAESASPQGNRRLYLAAALAGVLAGLCAAAFHALLDVADRWRSNAPTLLGEVRVPGWLAERSPDWLAPWLPAVLPGWALAMLMGALVLTLAAWLVRRFAPEAAGSGIQEIESILGGERTMRWRRVLPVKFLGGVLAVGSGLVLGREGPTVHMGGALGQMAGAGLKLDPRRQRTLIAAGAAAGLAAAFNAPLAAIVFVTEELREGFEYGFASVQSTILACCLAVAVSGWLLGQGPVLPVSDLHLAPLWALPLFLALGVGIGVLGWLFNLLLLGSVRAFGELRQRLGLLPATLAGAALGALVWFAPQAVGGGESLVESLLLEPPALLVLGLLLAVRLLATVGSYGLGLPGGIFAPLLALGTIAGAGFDALIQGLDPGLGLSPGLFAVAAMGALFAATVRAPLTGTVLAIELTGALELVLPIVLTCLAAAFAAEALGGRPIYSQLLAESGRTDRPRRAALRPVLAGGALLGALLLAGLPDLPRHPGAQPVQPVAAESQPRPVGAGPAEAGAPQVAGSQAQALPAAPPEPATEPPEPAVQGSEGPRYAVQVASFRSPEGLLRYARRHRLLEESGTLEPAGGWYPLLVGDYGTREEAQAALSRLPPALRRGGPVVRELPAGTRPLPQR